METLAKEGESPVKQYFKIYNNVNTCKNITSILNVKIYESKTRKSSCLNLGVPPSKPKYFYLTDSVQVPWGKGEKNPKKGVKKNLEIPCLQSVDAWYIV